MQTDKAHSCAQKMKIYPNWSPNKGRLACLRGVKRSHIRLALKEPWHAYCGVKVQAEDVDLWRVIPDKAAPASSEHLSYVDPRVGAVPIRNTGLEQCCEKKRKNPAQLVKWQDQIIKFSNLSGAEAYSAKCQDIIFRMAFPYLMPATLMEQLNTF